MSPVSEATDLAEDAAYGEDQCGDELPKELATREGRLVKLRAAKQTLADDAASDHLDRFVCADD